MTIEELKALVRDVPDFPTEGIVFKDLMPLIGNGEAFHATIELLAEWAGPRSPDIILGAEARGFIFGGALAYELGCGFVPARKPGKLPYKTVTERYALEYGDDGLQLHQDAVGHGDRVLIVDDLLATGGTAEATAKLVTKLGGEVVGFSFLISLDFLPGRERLGREKVCALLSY